MKDISRRTSSLSVPPRLQCMVDQLLAPYEVWDLCCDHGLIGQRAYAMGCFQRVVFVDVVPHIMNWLKHDFLSRFGLARLPAKVLMKTGDATAMKFPSSNANFVIGGVGAFLMIRILERIPCGPHQRLILSPNKNPQQVLDKALQLGFRLREEISVQEGPRERWVLVLDSPPVH